MEFRFLSKALTSFPTPTHQRSGPWVPLANLYFARHQYDQALNTLVRQRALYESGRVNNEGENKALIAKLRALGLRRMFLHAHSVSFVRPEGGEFSINTPLPQDLAALLDALAARGSKSRGRALRAADSPRRAARPRAR